MIFMDRDRARTVQRRLLVGQSATRSCVSSLFTEEVLHRLHLVAVNWFRSSAVSYRWYRTQQFIPSYPHH